MPEEPILEFKDVSLRFGESWALRNISLTLEPGETRIIFGAAGSGKTTLLKAVVGLVRVDKGSIKLFGQDVTKLSENELFVLRRRAGVLFQEGGLFDSLTVGENVEYPLVTQDNLKQVKAAQAGEAQTFDPEKLVRDTLRFVELEQTFDKFPAEISGGMRRRVGIARAVVTEPLLVLYDSPTAGLDPITANTIMALLAKERDVRNSASLVVTHRYQDGEIMADFRYDSEQEALLSSTKSSPPPKPALTKFMVMKEGEIVFLGTRPELESSNDEYVKRFVRHEDRHAQ
ncbi:MAG TPA: ATP-binding cassette domain-containing protein [Bryobacteraceae bacterium]|nr:ATP-binding cassette domain-containing protein [Bryobacteraceae bacterium]